MSTTPNLASFYASLYAEVMTLRHELAKRQPHEFAGPTDERGCCAVCHEPVDFLPHQPFTLRAELHWMTGLWYGACAARTEKSVEIAELRKRLAALEGTDHAA